MKTWKIKDKIYLFPKSWDKDKVIQYVNTDIKVCPLCSKIAAGLNHFSKCNPEDEALKQQRIEDYY